MKPAASADLAQLRVGGRDPVRCYEIIGKIGDLGMEICTTAEQANGFIKTDTTHDSNKPHQRSQASRWRRSAGQSEVQMMTISSMLVLGGLATGPSLEAWIASNFILAVRRRAFDANVGLIQVIFSGKLRINRFVL